MVSRSLLPVLVGVLLSALPAGSPALAFEPPGEVVPAPESASGAGAVRQEAPMAVVVHPGVPVETLSQVELRDLVLGNQRFWTGGLRTEMVVISAAGPARNWFVRRISGMSEVQFRQYWIGQVFRGRASNAPRAVPDRATALSLVAALPGAMAIVDAGNIPAGVKVLRIDGRLPGDPGYPLR